MTDGFIPTVSFSADGLMGTSHYVITQNAILAIDIEFFNIIELTVSMTKARDEIAAANAQVDTTNNATAWYVSI